jgi:galactose mutarotase-like enzyme
LALPEENVVITAGECTLTLMPHLGGKIASIRVGSHELLQAPLNPYAPRTRTMSFDEGDASGWDECLPSVAACTIQTPAGQADIPDHGDLWRIPWQVLSVNHDSATLRANCFSLPLQLTRTIALDETPTGFKLQLLYSLTNMGAYLVPWAWAAHPLFAADEGDQIVLDIEDLRVEGSAGATLGPSGKRIPWPKIERTGGSISDLSIVQNPDSGIGDKIFAGPFFLPSEPASASLERKQIGLRLTVIFDPAITPYLGLWLCYGGWPEGPGPKQVCVALEPTTANEDSLAGAAQWSKWLDPGETVTWPMELHIDRLESPPESPADQQEEYT